MNSPYRSTKSAIIILGLICCVISLGCLSPASQVHVPGETPGIPVTKNVTTALTEESQPRGYTISCSINEIDRGIVMNSTVLSFSEDLGKIAPELERGMREARESPGGWYDGRRHVNSVTLGSDVNEIFCNTRNPSDICINGTSVYEYQGRYFDFVCTAQSLTHPTAGGSPAG